MLFKGNRKLSDDSTILSATTTTTKKKGKEAINTNKFLLDVKTEI